MQAIMEEWFIWCSLEVGQVSCFFKTGSHCTCVPHTAVFLCQHVVCNLSVNMLGESWYLKIWVTVVAEFKTPCPSHPLWAFSSLPSGYGYECVHWVARYFLAGRYFNCRSFTQMGSAVFLASDKQEVLLDLATGSRPTFSDIFTCLHGRNRWICQ